MNTTYQCHPLSDMWEPLDGEEFDGLVADISKHGLREPITLYEGKVLDGRNRLLACALLDIEPATKTFEGTYLEAIALVWSLNDKRRHLSSSQRAIANAKCEQKVKAYQSVREDAQKRQKAGKGDDGSGGRGKKKNLSQQIDQGFVDPNAGRTSTIRAKAARTNRHYINLADKLVEEQPELAKAVAQGKKTLTQVQRDLREQKRKDRRQENAVKAANASDLLSVGAKFATILIDPPWDWGDEGDVNQLGRAKPDYHTMSHEELLALPVGKLADEDCHLYCWVTNRSMPKVFSLLGAWGFRYITLITWAKPSFGMGNYFRGQTEHVAFGVKGSQMLKRTDASTLLPTWKRGDKHSSKPVEFYEFIESCSPGPYLEVFGRTQRSAWTAWGADVE